MAPPSKACATRLTRELKQFRAAPPPLAPLVHVDEKDLLDWHILCEGAPSSPYEGGWYVMRIRFKPAYPFAAPAVSMITPNGRFAEGQSVCMSMTEVRARRRATRTRDAGGRSRTDGARDGVTWSGTDRGAFRVVCVAVAPGELESGVVGVVHRDGVHLVHEHGRAHERRGADDGGGETAARGGEFAVECVERGITEEVS